MEINKYFIPDIEDIRVGYEFELIKYSSNNYGLNKSECSWTKHTLKKEDIFSSGYKEDSFLETCISYLDSKHLRVPYLTKEQIEAEGWVEKQLNSNEQALKLYINKKGYHLRLYENCIRFSELMVGAGMMPCWDKILFEGEIKSINEFRYICKLLKI